MKTTENKTEYNDIDEYILSQPKEIGRKLEKIRQIIKKAAPEAKEVISYQMPAFKYHGIVMYFAAFKNHYSIFVRPEYLSVFKNEISEYKTSKSAVNIPNDSPVPEQLISKIAKFASEQNFENAMFRKNLKKEKKK